MKNNMFLIKENSDGTLIFLSNKNDPYQMNWIEGDHAWGTVIVPEGIKVQVTRTVTEEGNLNEEYKFTNETAFPVFFQNTDIGIYATFNDSYEDAATSLKQRCHTHLYCNGDAAYVMALRMGGKPPHLGLMMLEGALNGYSIQRNEENLSNDRGDFIIHPDIDKLNPGETGKISWELFWFQSREEFKDKILQRKVIPFLDTKQCTWYKGETVKFTVEYGQPIEENKISVVVNEKEIPFSCEKQADGISILCEYTAEETGEQNIAVQTGNKTLKARFYVVSSVKQLLKKRCHFIAEKQQYHKKGDALDGCYLIYDKESDRQYYSHLVHDHNGGRERMGMAVLIARYLQLDDDPLLEESLKKYLDYFYRELYDRNSGTVYNDMQRNNDWHRLYNYAWAATLQTEVYKWSVNPVYLEDAVKTYLKFYQEGGQKFYPIGIQIAEVLEEIEKSDSENERWGCDIEKLKKLFREHAENICQMGINYPPSEVNYEQSIVAPAANILLQAYKIFGNEKYLKAVEKQMEILSLFNGRQPDYYLFETAIRHWDGYWFGKRRMLGDTFPHYWSVLTGQVYKTYAKILKDTEIDEKGEASIRGCLNLFDEEGFGSCAMVYPKTINGKQAEYYDPWANDQDWALYYILDLYAKEDHKTEYHHFSMTR